MFSFRALATVLTQRNCSVFISIDLVKAQAISPTTLKYGIEQQLAIVSHMRIYMYVSLEFTFAWAGFKIGSFNLTAIVCAALFYICSVLFCLVLNFFSIQI